MALRGKGGKAVATALANSTDRDGAKIFKASSPPPCPPRKVALRIVDCYKHLGSIVCPDGNLMPEARARANAAMATFAPLAVKIFGSSSITQHCKIAVAWSLCMSRLLLWVHCWQRFCNKPRSVVNTPYNQIWRRIAGHPRFGKCELTDLQVRILLGVLSIDCVVRQRRLTYLGRIAQETTPFLSLLLQQRTPKGEPLPWTKLI